MNTREQAVIERIEQRRRRPRRKLREDRVTLAHGAGSSSTQALIEAVFLPAFANETFATLADSAVLTSPGGRLAFTTDSFVVKPLLFPGGSIGELAVNGTVNDLATTGARPLWLAASFIIEEGFAIDDLRQIAASIGSAARAAGVVIATGDTKVVERGKADGLYICTTGIGVIEHSLELTPSAVCCGDRVLVSGTIADHGMAVMIARGELELEVDLASDTAPLGELVGSLLENVASVRWLRDPTRGGLATTLNELALAAELAIVIDEAALPLRQDVVGACEILGVDPLHVANEGKVVAVVGEDDVDCALQTLRDHPLGRAAAVIGEVRSDPPGMVLLETAFGGSRIVDMLAGDPLPRIC